MSGKAWWIAGGTVVGLAGALAAHRGFHEPIKIEPARVEALARPLEPRNDVTALRSELALMKAQVVSLHGAMAERTSPQPPAPTTRAEAPDPATLQERRLEGARRWQEHMAEVAATFEDEALDRNFAATAQASVERALESQPALKSAAGKVDCRSRTCRLEVRKDGAGLVDKQLPLFLRAVGGVLPRAQADHIEGENGQKTMVLYLANGNPAMEPRR